MRRVASVNRNDDYCNAGDGVDENEVEINDKTKSMTFTPIMMIVQFVVVVIVVMTVLMMVSSVIEDEGDDYDDS
jgi:ABC-type Na+ efflux pump permease subunit